MRRSRIKNVFLISEEKPLWLMYFSLKIKKISKKEENINVLFNRDK